MKKRYSTPSVDDSTYQLSGPVLNVEGSHQIESFNQKDMMNLGGDIGESSDAKTRSVLWSDGKDSESQNYDFKLW